jgi:membrane-associated phospholipid phosphatase
MVKNKHSYVFVVLSVFFLFLFTVFSYEIYHGFMKNMDFAVTVKIQERIDNSTRLRLAEFVGNVMEGATFTASPEFSLIFLFTLTGIVCVDFQKKQFRLRGLIIPLLFGLLIIGELYGKTVVHHPAPPFYMIKNPTTIFPKFYINDQFSYPSGHTARAVFLSLSLYSFLIFHSAFFIKVNRRIGGLILILIYIGLVSVSRIYLGHHWLSDILGGALLGLPLWIVVHMIASIDE